MQTAEAERIARIGGTARAGSTPLVRTCLDWSARRHHLAGRWADALLSRMLADGWLRRHPAQPRALQLGRNGREGFAAVLGVHIP